MSRKIAVTIAAGLLLVVPATRALAAFARTAHVSGSRVSTATLGPPASLAVQFSCVSATEAQAELSWTPTPSAFADGYVLERWTGGSLETQTTITPRSVSSATQSSLAPGQSYEWKMHSFANLWTSTVITIDSTAPGCQ